MKRLETASNTIELADTKFEQARDHGRADYQKVCDERKRPIRGLWKRNDRFYVQMTVEDKDTGKKQVKRIPLEGAKTPAQARKKMNDLDFARRNGKLPVLKLAPKFDEYADRYLEHFEKVKDAKRESTLETEGYAIDRWKEHLGDRRLNNITRSIVDQFIAKRQSEGRAARTVNLEVTTLRNVLNMAIDDRILTILPTNNLRPLKVNSAKRALSSANDIEKLCAIVFKPIFFKGRLSEPPPSSFRR